MRKEIQAFLREEDGVGVIEVATRRSYQKYKVILHYDFVL